MFPVIYDFGEVNIFGFSFHPVINSYGFMLMTAFYICYYLLHKDLKRLDYKPALAGDIVFAAAIGGIIGSRIYFLLENFEQFLNDPIGMIFSGGGLVFLGGLLGGLLAVTYIIKKNNLRWIAFADIVAPLLILGYAIGRVGCFLVGDDYGVPTNLPWGMSFPRGAPPTYQNVHPTQIYEAVLGFSIFLILSKLRLKSKPLGSIFAYYLIFAGMERFIIEFIRTNEKYMLGLSGAQIISLVMLGIGIIFLIQLGKHSNNNSLAGGKKLNPD